MPNTHNIYDHNQFSNSYKTDEQIIKQIVKDNTKCVNESDLLKITISYKSHTINNWISENNLSSKILLILVWPLPPYLDD